MSTSTTSITDSAIDRVIYRGIAINSLAGISACNTRYKIALLGGQYHVMQHFGIGGWDTSAAFITLVEAARELVTKKVTNKLAADMRYDKDMDINNRERTRKEAVTTKFLFRSRSAAGNMVELLEELNILSEGSDEYEYIRDTWESILDSYVQCRHRCCGTCNGVGCEDSMKIGIPNSILNATREQREKAGKAEPTKAQLSQWQHDDEGRCHW